MQSAEVEVRRGNFKTLRLTVTDAGSVLVRAPINMKQTDIDAFVARHTRWIQKRIASLAEVPDFSDGSTLEIAGLIRTIREGKPKLDGETLFLPKEGREEALIALLKRITRTRMKALLDETAQKYGFSYAGLSVTKARTRWGACSGKKRISFSFRTAFLPDEVCLYLAVHELCHTRHMDHSAKFWREVERILPDYAALRRKLKSYLWATKCLKS